MSSASHQFVVLAYGISRYLPACLESVCNQQGVGSQVLITTSTPSPHISELAKRFAVELHATEPKGGIAADWNFGLNCATADLVTLAHQDDVYYPGFAEQTCRLFASSPHAALCFTDYDEIDDAGQPLPSGRVMFIKRMLRSLSVGRRNIVESRARKCGLLAFGSAIPCPSVTLNRAALPDFRFSEEYQINLDWDAWWRLRAVNAPFLTLHQSLMGHRIHQDAETSRGKRDGRRREEDRLMFRRIWPPVIADLFAALYTTGY